MDAMRDGDDRRAHAVNDDVLRRRLLAGALPDDPRLPYHERFVWTGRPFNGADVLVRNYHGLGDTLMMARFLLPLVARAASVRVEAPPPLVFLLGGMVPACRFLPFDHRHPLPPAAVDVEITELSHALRLGPAETLPRPPPCRAAPLRPGAVGVCWRAGEWDARRSVPLDRLAPLLRASGRPLVALQQGPARRDARACWPTLFDAVIGEHDDLARTASVVAGCALVISVDTMVAHLALLLGRPTIVLLRADADWRWGRPGRPSPWYPGATLLRQQRDGEWDAPLAALALRLRAEG